MLYEYICNNNIIYIWLFNCFLIENFLLGKANILLNFWDFFKKQMVCTVNMSDLWVSVMIYKSFFFLLTSLKSIKINIQKVLISLFSSSARGKAAVITPIRTYQTRRGDQVLRTWLWPLPRGKKGHYPWGSAMPVWQCPQSYGQSLWWVLSSRNDTKILGMKYLCEHLGLVICMYVF